MGNVTTANDGLGYRVIARPGPGLATIAEPGGRVGLWSLTRVGGRHFTTCARSGEVAKRFYRPSLMHHRGVGSVRLCRACVEGDTA